VTVIAIRVGGAALERYRLALDDVCRGRDGPVRGWLVVVDVTLTVLVSGLVSLTLVESLEVKVTTTAPASGKATFWVAPVNVVARSLKLQV